jgi:hypothetical protein
VWPDDALAAQLGTVVDILRRKASFWVKHGVLTESPGRGKLTYTRALVLSSGEGGHDADDGPIAMEEDEGRSALVSQEEQLKQVRRYLDLLPQPNNFSKWNRLAEHMSYFLCTVLAVHATHYMLYYVIKKPSLPVELRLGKPVCRRPSCWNRAVSTARNFKVFR